MSSGPAAAPAVRMPVCPSRLIVVPGCGGTTGPNRGSPAKTAVAARRTCCTPGSERRFEQFLGAEARTRWRDGRGRLVTSHPDTPDELPQPDLASLAPLVEGMGLPFVTADLVQREDGVGRLVELGDGQVSDRPSSCPAADLVAALA